MTELVDDYGVNADENIMKEVRRNSQLVEEEKERENTKFIKNYKTTVNRI